MNSNLLRNRLTFGRNYGRISSVVRHNTDAVVAQLDRALGYGPRCREFESSRPHTLKLLEKSGSFFARSYKQCYMFNKADKTEDSIYNFIANMRAAKV